MTMTFDIKTHQSLDCKQSNFLLFKY